MWMGIVAYKFEIFILEIKEILHVGIDLHRRQWARLTCKLELCLLYMVQIEMRIASGVDKVTWLITRHLSHHLKQQGVAGDVEGHSKEGVC